MAQALAALSISAGILLLVVGLVIGVSMIAVKRGTAAMEEEVRNRRP